MLVFIYLFIFITILMIALHSDKQGAIISHKMKSSMLIIGNLEGEPNHLGILCLTASQKAPK